MYLHQRKVRALLKLVREASVVPPWTEPGRFLAALHRLIPCDAAVVFMRLDTKTHRIMPSDATLSSHDAGEAERLLHEHNEHYWRHKQPILERIVRRELNAFDLETTPLRFLPLPQRDEYRHDYWARHRIRHCYARYFRTPGGLTNVTLTRSSSGRAFTAEDKCLLDMLAPHLGALCAVREVHTMFCNTHGDVKLADADMERLLQSAPGLTMRLRDWVRRAAAQPLYPLQVQYTQGTDMYRFTIAAGGEGAATFYRVSCTLESAHHDADILALLARRHQLSRREAQVLALLASGRQIKEMARDLGLSPETVKEYLGTLYRKAGVTGRAALMAQVLRCRAEIS